MRSMTKKKIFSKNVIKYIEAIFYVLAIVIGIFVCYAGPIYIKMLPILFVLGFVGRIIFDRPIVTTIFGIITAICIIRVTSNIEIRDSIFFSLCDGLNIALGELCGEYFIRSKKIFKKSKIKNKIKIPIYCLTIFLFILSIGVHMYLNGNYISYFNAKNALVNYLDDEYKDEKFKEIKCIYNFYKNKRYTFVMKNETSNISSNFIAIKTKEWVVFDEYKIKFQSQNNTKLNKELEEFFKNEDFNLDYKIAYLDNGNLKILLSRNVVNIDEENINTFVNDVTKYIKMLENFRQYSHISNIEITLINKKDNSKNLISNILPEEIEKIGDLNSYIKNSFEIEYIE